MTALSTAEAALRRMPDDPTVPVTLTGAEAVAVVAELDRLRERQTESIRLLRLAASGRRDYSQRAPASTRDVLEQEALTFEQAAQIVKGDHDALRSALPSWRWEQIEVPDA